MQYWLPGSRVQVCILCVTHSHQGSRGHVRLPSTKNFQKIFPQKKHIIATPMTRGRDKRLTWPKGFGAFMVNRCAVLWCGRDLWVETTHSHLPCLALCRKTTLNKQRAAKPYKMAMNWAQVTQKKQLTIGPSLRNFYICAYISAF